MNGFKSVPDNNEHGITHRYLFNNNIEIGKYRVMFGYRLRAGDVDSDCCDLDICCGAEEHHYKEMEHKIMTIMASQPEDPFKGIPSFSKVKPYFNDEEFCNIINKLYENCR